MPRQLTGCAGMFLALVLAWLWPAVPVFAHVAHVETGTVVEDMEMPTLDGGRDHLLGEAVANVFVFFKTGQEHSRATMKQIARIEKEMAGKSVRWVAIVSDQTLRPEIEAEVKEAGLAMPVLLDVGAALYGKLGVALQPVVGITGKDHKLVAYQPFTKVNYAEVVRARIRHLLGEIDDPELEKVLKPPAATFGDDADVARRYLMLAEKLFQVGDHAEAIASLKKGLAKDPSLAAAHALLGYILAAQGDKNGALAAFEQALKLDPSNARALEGRKNCEKRN